MVTEVRSPVSRPGSKVGSIRSGDLSPSARSNPSRGDRGRRDTGNNALEPRYEPAGQQARDRRDQEQQQQEEQQRRDRRRDEEQQNEERWQQAHSVARANSEPEMPEREQR